MPRQISFPNQSVKDLNTNLDRIEKAFDRAVEITQQEGVVLEYIKGVAYEGDRGALKLIHGTASTLAIAYPKGQKNFAEKLTSEEVQEVKDGIKLARQFIHEFSDNTDTITQEQFVSKYESFGFQQYVPDHVKRVALRMTNDVLSHQLDASIKEAGSPGHLLHLYNLLAGKY